MAMEFEWDGIKSDTCFRDRGFDFAYVVAVFADPNRMIKTDTRFCYGEARYQLTGSIEGRLYVLIYTPRNDRIRIISARKANMRETKKYEDHKNEA
jgi:uncharacterized DUF497 family protein